MLTYVHYATRDHISVTPKRWRLAGATNPTRGQTPPDRRRIQTGETGRPAGRILRIKGLSIPRVTGMCVPIHLPPRIPWDNSPGVAGSYTIASWTVVESVGITSIPLALRRAGFRRPMSLVRGPRPRRPAGRREYRIATYHRWLTLLPPRAGPVALLRGSVSRTRLRNLSHSLRRRLNSSDSSLLTSSSNGTCSRALARSLRPQ